VYGPHVHVDINGANWHTESRNIMKIAAQQLRERNQSSSWSPSLHADTSRAYPSPVASGTSLLTPVTHGERSGSTRDHASPEILAAESGQGDVAKIVQQMLAGAYVNDLSDVVCGLSQPAADTLRTLQEHLCKLHGVHLPPVRSCMACHCSLLLFAGCI
jgi:hypothetical protein